MNYYDKERFYRALVSNYEGKTSKRKQSRFKTCKLAIILYNIESRMRVQFIPIVRLRNLILI